MESYYLGDSCICWSFGKIIDVDLNIKVLHMYKQLKESEYVKELGIFDIVPSFNAIAVYFDPMSCSPQNLKKEISTYLTNLDNKYNKISELHDEENIIIPVIYDGLDLIRISEIHSLTVEEVILLHTKSIYQVAMIGFKPHFPYLIGLNPKLETPRLESPRTKIPAGSVAIGGAQTGIYPVESPGGWNLIGRTDPKLLKMLKPGDKLKMKRSQTL